MFTLLLTVVVLLASITFAVIRCHPPARFRPPTARATPPGEVGIGTVRTVAGPIVVDVESISALGARRGRGRVS